MLCAICAGLSRCSDVAAPKGSRCKLHQPRWQHAIAFSSESWPDSCHEAADVHGPSRCACRGRVWGYSPGIGTVPGVHGPGPDTANCSLCKLHMLNCICMSARQLCCTQVVQGQYTQTAACVICTDNARAQTVYVVSFQKHLRSAVRCLPAEGTACVSTLHFLHSI